MQRRGFIGCLAAAFFAALTTQAGWPWSRRPSISSRAFSLLAHLQWYPPGQMPRSPFPYYSETMTGFEYVVATLQVLYGDRAGAERTVRNIRARYDGVKRNPFDEAECGHHYARALAAWSVFRAFEK